MTRLARLSVALVLVLLAACSGPPPLRDDPAPELRAHRVRALVRDRAGGAYVVRDALVWAPEASLLGTTKGEERDFLRVIPAGGKETDTPVSVNLQEVTTMVVEELDEIPTRLLVTIQFRGVKRTGKQFVGTIRSNVELRGRYEDSGYPCHIPMRQVAEVAIAGEETP